MTALLAELWKTFQQFVGEGWIHWLLALFAVLFVCVGEKRNRYSLLYPAAGILLVFFNPLIYGTIGIRFMNGMYWRMLWLIPLVPLVAMGVTALYSRAKTLLLRCLVLFAAGILVIFGGSPIYTRANFTPAQNVYQIPQVAIDVADCIIRDLGEQETDYAVVPDELLCYIRQYTSRVELVYGRNAYGYIQEMSDDCAVIHNEMVKQVPDVEKAALYSKGENAQYIVFNSAYHKGYDAISQYGFAFLERVDGYDIYRCE